MKTLLALFTGIVAIAAVLFFGADPAREPIHGGVTRAQGRPMSSDRPASAGLAEVAPGAPARLAENAPALELSERPREGERARESFVPLNMEIINLVTMEPTPFLLVRVSDREDNAVTGRTDKEGRISRPASLLPGPISVEARVPVSRRFHGKKSPHQESLRGDTWLEAPSSPNTPGPVARCLVDVPRFVPVRLAAEGEDGPKPAPFAMGADFYGTDTSSKTSFKMQVVFASQLFLFEEVQLAGATHLLSLRSIAGSDAAALAWDPARASELVPERRLELYGFVEGQIFGVTVPAARLPNLGDMPLEVKLTKMELQEITLPAALAHLSIVHGDFEKKARAKEELEARKTHSLSILVRTASGTYDGSVSVRASPTAAARSAHKKTSIAALRKQWVDAACTPTSGNTFEAHVTLDALDEAEYAIRVVCLDGESTSTEPLKIMVPHSSSDAVQILISDR